MREQELQELHASVRERLQGLDQRYTRNRQALVGALVSAGGPVPIVEILELDADLPQSSVYRNLGVLEEAGVVRRVTGSDEFSRYELAEDLTEHHHHLVCTSCGAVADFTVSSTVEKTIDRVAREVARDTGFKPEHHSLDFLGTCGDCT